MIWLLAILAGVLSLAQPAAAEAPTVVTRPATPLGNDGLTVNGSIHPHGLPTTYYFEYGRTAAYGQKTPVSSLPPRLAAHYREGWDENTGGWHARAGAAPDLLFFPTNGAAGGFVRFTEPSLDDDNHITGIGTVHLAQYAYPGPWGSMGGTNPSMQLAAGDPDLRDARVSLFVRGQNWSPNRTELHWWTQSQKNIAVLNSPTAHVANWAYTGFDLTDHLASGRWEKVDYRLWNDSAQWSYAGGSGTYRYWSVNDAQAHVNVDFFHMLTFVDANHPPTGAIDFDEFELTYHNYSLLLPSNGGTLLRWPKDGDDPATLTDGWRHGAGHTWRSALNPADALEFVYGFKDAITIRAVQLHQNPEWPAKDVEVLVSADDQKYTPLVNKLLPETGVPNSNYAFALATGLTVKTKFLKVRVTSGYKDQRWGLGEIEIFGDGATMTPEDDVNCVNFDLAGLQAGNTYHYRLVAESATGKTTGADQVFAVPGDQKPDVLTGSTDHVTDDGARVTGRLTPMGLSTQYYFEYGLDTNYGARTALNNGGNQIVPRTVLGWLSGLKSGGTYHYRLVAVNAQGTTTGRDAEFKFR